ncbi:YHYH domain-containing protein [Bacillus cihuensis]|uniref:YHYH domain-containing protein n=1 Tax=Bacillus cihuensis TaxID=1208599 RepID=UPI00048F3480|nr:YHYH domain-containing protein [Bacillus cihuensis]
MKKLSIGLLPLVLVTTQVPKVDAHPGRTDSNGGHYRWTNCKMEVKFRRVITNGLGSSKTLSKPSTSKPATVSASVYLNCGKQSYNLSAYIITAQHPFQ